MAINLLGDEDPGTDFKTGEVHEASVFVGALGFSQLLFAWASEDMKSRNWLSAHRRRRDCIIDVAYTFCTSSALRDFRKGFGTENF